MAEEVGKIGKVFNARRQAGLEAALERDAAWPSPKA